MSRRVSSAGKRQSLVSNGIPHAQLQREQQEPPAIEPNNKSSSSPNPVLSPQDVEAQAIAGSILANLQQQQERQVQADLEAAAAALASAADFFYPPPISASISNATESILRQSSASSQKSGKIADDNESSSIDATASQKNGDTITAGTSTPKGTKMNFIVRQYDSTTSFKPFSFVPSEDNKPGSIPALETNMADTTDVLVRQASPSLPNMDQFSSLIQDNNQFVGVQKNKAVDSDVNPKLNPLPDENTNQLQYIQQHRATQSHFTSKPQPIPTTTQLEALLGHSPRPSSAPLKKSTVNIAAIPNSSNAIQNPGTTHSANSVSRVSSATSVNHYNNIPDTFNLNKNYQNQCTSSSISQKNLISKNNEILEGLRINAANIIASGMTAASLMKSSVNSPYTPYSVTMTSATPSLPQSSAAVIANEAKVGKTDKGATNSTGQNQNRLQQQIQRQIDVIEPTYPAFPRSFRSPGGF